MESYKLQVNDCQLKIYSVKPEISETAILFLHGGPGSGAKAIMELSAFQTLSQEFHCIYFDQRGSGLSEYDLRNGLSIETITNDVLQIVASIKERWGIQNLFLWGGSFGGCLASLCLERFAEQFCGVILSSPAITFYREEALEFYNLMKKPYTHRFNDSVIKTFKTLDDATPEEFFSIPQVRQFVYSDLNPPQSLRHICAMSSWFYQHSFENMIKNIETPTLIMQGKDDRICQYQYIDNQIIKYNNPNIEYYLYDQCGHEVFIDKESEFIYNMEQFIRRVISG